MRVLVGLAGKSGSDGRRRPRSRPNVAQKPRAKVMSRHSKLANRRPTEWGGVVLARWSLATALRSGHEWPRPWPNSSMPPRSTPSRSRSGSACSSNRELTERHSPGRLREGAESEHVVIPGVDRDDLRGPPRPVVGWISGVPLTDAGNAREVGRRVRGNLAANVDELAARTRPHCSAFCTRWRRSPESAAGGLRSPPCPASGSSWRTARRGLPGATTNP